MAKSNKKQNLKYIEQVERTSSYQHQSYQKKPQTECYILHIICTSVVVNVAGGFTHALPHNMLLQSRRVCSLEFLPVAVLEVYKVTIISAAIPFRMAG